MHERISVNNNTEEKVRLEMIRSVDTFVFTTARKFMFEILDIFFLTTEHFVLRQPSRR